MPVAATKVLSIKFHYKPLPAASATARYERHTLLTVSYAKLFCLQSFSIYFTKILLCLLKVT